MSTFEREERYQVVKLSRLQDKPSDDMTSKEVIYRTAHFGKALVEAVVIESHWPEYEVVWRMLEDRITGVSRDVDSEALKIADDIVSLALDDDDCSIGQLKAKVQCMLIEFLRSHQ